MLIQISHLIQVNHAVTTKSSGGFDVFQRQSEIDPPGVGDVQIVGVILVPFLDGGENLSLICAENVHVLHRNTDVQIISTESCDVSARSLYRSTI